MHSITRQYSLSLIIAATLIVQGLTAPPPSQAASSKWQAEEALTLSNDHLELTLYGGGVFTLSSIEGKALLFPGGTSYLSMRVDGTTYVSTLLDELPAQSIEQEELPAAVDSTKARERFVSDNGVRFELSYELVGPAVRFRIRAENRGDESRSTRVRFLLDTQVADNDGSPLWARGSVYTNETEMDPSVTVFKGYDTIPNPDFTSTGVFVTSPEHVAFVHWPTASESPWEYLANSEQPFYIPGHTESPESDSAVLVYYDLGELTPGTSAQAEFYYGLAAPEEKAAADALILELQRTRATVEARIDADLNRLQRIHTRTYQAVYENMGSSGLFKALIGGGELSVSEIHFAESGDPSGLATSGVRMAGELMLGSLREKTRSAIEKALPAVYRDLKLEPDNPELAQEIRRALKEHLEIDELRNDVTSSFTALEQTIRERGLSEEHPTEAVIATLRTYRSQLELTNDQEALLIWPNPESGTMSFRPTGLLTQYDKVSRALESVGGLGETMEWTGYVIGVGAAAKVVVALATVGGSVPLEAIGMAVVGTAFTLGGGRVNEGVAESHAFAGVRSAIVAGGELDLLLESSQDVVEAVEQSLTDPGGWRVEGSVHKVTLDDIFVEEGEDIGTAQGSVTVGITGDQEAVVSVYATMLGPVGTERAPISILGQPSPTTVASGTEEEIGFDYGAPDTKIWREASGYPVDLWVAFGYRPIHVSDDPSLAQGLQVFVGSPEAVELMRYGTETVVHTAELGENQSSRREIRISGDAASTTLDLSYAGSDFDLHLYGRQGQHVGLNYDTGQVEIEIPGVTYSGVSARPEWMQIDGHASEAFEVEVVAVQAEAPERFTVVSREEPSLPAMLGADPLDILITSSTEGMVESSFAVYEYGGQSGVASISAEAPSLEGDGGQSVSVDAIELQVPETLDAGEEGAGLLRLVDRSLEAGTYEGLIRLSAIDAGSGSTIDAATQVCLHVIGPGGQDDNEGSSHLGLVVLIVIAAVAGLVIYAFVRTQRMKLAAEGVGPIGGRRPARATLVVLRGPDAGRRIPLTGATFTIGRSRESMLHLGESNVSRRHAALRFARGRWFLQDQGSTVGTFVNGQRVDATALSDGDVIRIGEVELQFRVG